MLPQSELSVSGFLWMGLVQIGPVVLGFIMQDEDDAFISAIAFNLATVVGMYAGHTPATVHGWAEIMERIRATASSFLGLGFLGFVAANYATATHRLFRGRPGK